MTQILQSTPMEKGEPSTLFSHNMTTFSEWKYYMGNRFGKLTISTQEREFHGRVRSRNLGTATITEISASPHQIHNLDHALAPEKSRVIKLSQLLAGHSLVTQDGRTAGLSPGDLAIYDTGRPYTLDFADDMRVLIMIFPLEMIGIPPKLIEQTTAIRLPGDSGIGKVISPFMQHIAAHLEVLDGINGERILHSALDLISVLLSAELSKPEHAEYTAKKTKKNQIRHFIETHLGDSELNTEFIAAAYFMSARKLQYLFQEDGETVSDYIRNRRLERSRLDLKDPGLNSLPIQHIALIWGFSDAAHFSRLFKASYGISPKDYRAISQPVGKLVP